MSDVDEKIICNWRVTKGIPSGVHVWFDPNTESVRLYRVPTREQQPSRDMTDSLDAGVGPGYLDKVGSVSELEDEGEDSQARDFDNGSQLDLVEDLPF